MADDIKGLEELKRRILGLPPALLRQAGAALYRAAVEKIEGPAKDNCPWQDGTLAGTITTLEPEYHSRGVTVRVVAGGPSAPYAIAIHEHLSAYSPPTWKKAEEAGRPVRFQTGGPKYLEKALNEASGSIVDECAKEFDMGIAAKESS